jgi:murein DD-endopeptidase MepM/ murein hydrolase activator NlpD
MGLAAAPPGASGTASLPPVVAVPQVAGVASTPQAIPKYVFPVFGTNAKFSSDYGAPRAGTGWHHGNDIFAPIGTPVLATADGVLSKVGVNTLGGNRLWLRDDLSNTYYYAHLSGYASHVADGVRVRAGEIIAFVGNTGQAITTPPHLHFEIHPGDGPSVDPYPYLVAWQRGTDVALAFTAAVAARGQAPAVGAVLVGSEPPPQVVSDVGDGLARAVP